MLIIIIIIIIITIIIIIKTLCWWSKHIIELTRLLRFILVLWNPL